MIWKDTRRFGIATATGKKGNQTCTYVAALYRPPGNIEEFYSDNIFIGKLKRDQYCDNVKRNAIQRIYKKILEEVQITAQKKRLSFNPFITDAVIIWKPVHWFLYDNGLCHERVKYFFIKCE